MKALTVWQPWASLIVLGFKPYEFRGWAAHKSIVGERIAIHAGVRPARKSEIDQLLKVLDSRFAWRTCLKPEARLSLEHWSVDPRSMYHGAVLGTATLGEPTHSADIFAEFGGPVNDSDRGEHSNWAWPMQNPVACEPVPVRGAQGFWNFEGSV